MWGWLRRVDVNDRRLRPCRDTNLRVGGRAQTGGHMQPGLGAVGGLPAVQALRVAARDVAVRDDRAAARDADLAAMRMARQDQVRASRGERRDDARVRRVRDAQVQDAGMPPRRGWSPQAVTVNMRVVGSQQ